MPDFGNLAYIAMLHNIDLTGFKKTLYISIEHTILQKSDLSNLLYLVLKLKINSPIPKVANVPIENLV